MRGNDNELVAEMQAAFDAIVGHDAHVAAWRANKSALQAPCVERSVSERRALWGATGIPESAARPRPEPIARMLPDPMLTDAEYFHKRRTKISENAGKAEVKISAVEWIGGLARLAHTDVQAEVAAKYRMLHERAQLGGARAIDYSAVKVDTFGNANLDIADIGAGARSSYEDAVQFLGMIRSNLVERVIVHDMPVSQIAGSSARARSRTTRMLLDALDDLAVHFKLSARKAA